MKKFALALTLLMPIAAHSAVVDFNSNPDNTYFFTPVLSGGFSFADVGDDTFGTAINLDSSSASNGTVHLMDWTNCCSASTMRMTAQDGSLFNLSKFDFYSGYDNGSSPASSLVVRGYDVGGINTVTQTFFDVTDYNFSSFTGLSLTGFNAMSRIEFTANGDFLRDGYDNFIVSPAAAPEPASLALLGLGLAGLGFSRRRKA